MIFEALFDLIIAFLPVLAMLAIVGAIRP